MPTTTGSLGLFLQAEEPSNSNQSVELTLFGTAGSGHYGGVSLYTLAASGDNVASGVLPLFLAAPTVGSGTRTLPLFVEGRRYSLSSTVSLTAWNVHSGASSSVPLYLAGSGVTDGYQPYERSLSLFIQRNPSAAVSLFLQGPGTPASSGLSLLIHGSPWATGTVPLAMPEVVGWGTSSTRLYTHGF